MEVSSSGLHSFIQQSQIANSLRDQESADQKRVASKLLTSLDEMSPMKLAALADKNQDLRLYVKA